MAKPKLHDDDSYDAADHGDVDHDDPELRARLEAEQDEQEAGD